MIKSIVDYFKKHIFSVSIATAGFLSSIVTLCIDINSVLSIKWLILVIFISIVIITLLVGYIHNCNQKYFLTYNMFEKLPLEDLKKELQGCFLFKNNSPIKLSYEDIIKVYYIDEYDVENFIGIGCIKHIQSDNIIYHIKFYWLNEKRDNNMRKLYFSLILKNYDIQKLRGDE
ncbi:hypothetical protein CCAL9344_00680 [Campylobacter sp. RM9344]|uniref:DUF2393 domain protein n=1 Tax=Campylobacter californiensis TaxID=1032243 RepID=A0AAW3ZWR9_9BACT|nr:MULTISPECIES: hypothetical protein [unclassified Campylobacter]MBE2983866.1 hypothetical protein [Campylobacter sp. RM6883]MBE2985570.1 hypothetical protein [Campylobacter sp. RM12919]MBE2987401.1 hypothetical protein [Campylobacter sp. RM12920]MBE2994404.1 hypothetical protein [Campylobacter sp. RM6913]MBE3028712.1 hypothetical protein [Campylobacter sp. RM9344]